MIRYRTFRPTDEQKKCMELAAKKVYKWILITLVVAFVIKLAVLAAPMIATATAATSTAATGAAASTTQLAGFSTALKPIGALLAKAGHGSLFKGIFSTVSAAIKSKDASKISADIEAKEKEAKDKEIDGFKGAWNYCALPEKK